MLKNKTRKKYLNKKSYSHLGRWKYNYCDTCEYLAESTKHNCELSLLIIFLFKVYGENKTDLNIQKIFIHNEMILYIFYKYIDFQSSFEAFLEL